MNSPREKISLGIERPRNMALSGSEPDNNIPLNTSIEVIAANNAYAARTRCDRSNFCMIIILRQSFLTGTRKATSYTRPKFLHSLL